MATEKASPEVIAKLEGLLNQAADGLLKVTSKKMFGCHALFANENIFGLVWKHGRIGVKLPETKSYETLMGLKGATPWKAGPMQMAQWVLLPETLHSKPAELKKWVSKAHNECQGLQKEAKKRDTSKKSSQSAAVRKKTK